MSELALVGSALSFLAGLFVLFKLFQTEGVVKGIIGLICMLYTYIWGWQNIGKEQLKLKTWMYVWTAAIVIGIILNVVGGASGAGGE